MVEPLEFPNHHSSILAENSEALQFGRSILVRFWDIVLKKDKGFLATETEIREYVVVCCLRKIVSRSERKFLFG
jgi:hypothetical protein